MANPEDSVAKQMAQPRADLPLGWLPATHWVSTSVLSEYWVTTGVQ